MKDAEKEALVRQQQARADQTIATFVRLFQESAQKAAGEVALRVAQVAQSQPGSREQHLLEGMVYGLSLAAKAAGAGLETVEASRMQKRLEDAFKDLYKDLPKQ